MLKKIRITTVYGLVAALLFAVSPLGGFALDAKQADSATAKASATEQAPKTPVASPQNEPESRLTNLAERLAFGADNVEVVWLGQQEGKRLAIFQPSARAHAHGAVITILAKGKILEHSEFARSIRQSLSASNWASLVVQSDKLETGGVSSLSAEQAQQLFSAAVTYLQQQSYSRFVLVADGDIATRLWPAIQNDVGSLLGFVGLDDWVAGEFSPSIPVLNVANSVMTSAVTNARKRFNLVKQTPSASCEMYFYDGSLRGDKGYGHLVSRRIRGWLQRKFVDAG